MIGECVLHRLGDDQYTLAAIAVERTADDVDLRAFAMFSDGRIGEVTIERVQRGPDVGQWQSAPWPLPDPVVPPPPQLASVQAELMPVTNLPAPPPRLMVIIRH